MKGAIIALFTVCVAIAALSGSADASVPVAAFHTVQESAYCPCVVNFEDDSVGASSWSWRFGDGETSTEQNPSHPYTKPGKYNVLLTVSSEAGNNTLAKQVVVLPGMTPTPEGWTPPRLTVNPTGSAMPAKQTPQPASLALLGLLVAAGIMTARPHK